MEKDKLIINVEASKNHCGAYAANVDGIWGAGDSIPECKADILKSIEEILAKPASQACQLPQWLREGNYEIEWHIDVKSLLQYYSNIFNMAGLQRLTGINQKQLHHYASGLSKPRPTQRARINEALHKLGQELLTLNI